MKLDIEVEGNIPVKFDQIADAVSKLNSDDFCLFMEMVFEFLDSECRTDHRYESQLCWIANSSKTQFKDAVKRINEFYILAEARKIIE